MEKTVLCLHLDWKRYKNRTFRQNFNFFSEFACIPTGSQGIEGNDGENVSLVTLILKSSVFVNTTVI